MILKNYSLDNMSLGDKTYMLLFPRQTFGTVSTALDGSGRSPQHLGHSHIWGWHCSRGQARCSSFPLIPALKLILVSASWSQGSFSCKQPSPGSFESQHFNAWTILMGNTIKITTAHFPNGLPDMDKNQGAFLPTSPWPLNGSSFYTDAGLLHQTGRAGGCKSPHGLWLALMWEFDEHGI